MASQSFQTTQNLLNLSGVQLVAEITRGAVSATEAVDAYIGRIEQVNPRINAVVVPLFAEAREAATAADVALARGEQPGPLHGLPVTIKECLDVRGTPSTWGLSDRAGDRAGSDDPLVARLRAAGAIIIGKTNVAQLLTGCESTNPLYGTTRNPWNPDRSAGGSSGGEAAILAAGGSLLGIGTDIGGSVRGPAHFSGVHGLKPTSGRLRTAQPRSIFHVRPEAAAMAQPGPMARTVADLTLAMQVLTDGDGRQPVMPDAIPLRGVRIGMYTDDGVLPAAPAIRRAVTEAAAALRERGAEVVPFAPILVRDLFKLYISLVCADGGEGLKRTLGSSAVAPAIARALSGQGIPDGIRPVIAGVLRLLGQEATGGLVLPSMRRRSAGQMQELGAARERFQTEFLGLMDAAGIDALICPPMAIPAVTHGGFTQLGGVEASYDVLFNITGMPAGVVSLSRVRPGEESDRPRSRDRAVIAASAMEQGSAGLPVGVQVAARHWREDLVLAIMAALEADFRVRADYPHTPVLP
jgi:fatty acid amide hydrolase